MAYISSITLVEFCAGQLRSWDTEIYWRHICAARELQSTVQLQLGCGNITTSRSIDVYWLRPADLFAEFICTCRSYLRRCRLERRW